MRVSATEAIKTITSPNQKRTNSLGEIQKEAEVKMPCIPTQMSPRRGSPEFLYQRKSLNLVTHLTQALT